MNKARTNTVTRRKVEVGDLKIPFQELTLTDGTVFRLYDTSGPQGHDPKDGIPKRRADWIAPRVARGDTNFSQMHYARKGIVTEEMQYVAAREGMDAEFRPLGGEDAAQTLVHSPAPRVSWLWWR